MLAKTLFFIAIQLAPFYFFPSGSVQIFHIFFILFILILIIGYKTCSVGIKDLRLVKSLVFFILYIVIIQSVYFIKTSEIVFLKILLFYIYNFIVFVFIVYAFYKDKAYIKIIYYSSSISIILLFFLFLIMFSGSVTSRTTLFFNNPNQLAYYVLLNISIISHIYINTKILNLKNKINTILFTFSFMASLLLMSISISKAGLASIVLLILILSFKNKKLFFIALFFIALFFIIFIIYNEEVQIIQLVIDRITNKAGGHSDGILIERGYIRILQYPEYLLFGAGEGMYTRFNAILEVHSFFGNIVFSYGIIGLFLFLFYLHSLYKTTSLNFIIMLVPLFLYGIVHNSIRNPIFWIYCALLFTTFQRDKNETK